MASKEDSKRRTTVYLPDDLIWMIKEVGARRRVKSDTLAVELAVREWVSREDTAAERASAPSKQPHIVSAKRGRG